MTKEQLLKMYEDEVEKACLSMYGKNTRNSEQVGSSARFAALNGFIDSIVAMINHDG